MTRKDFYRDPAAPKANRIVPAATAVIANPEGEILLQRRVDNGLWALPGGTMELGESLGATIIREVKEETGLDIEPVDIVGIYSDPEHVIAYDDGEVRQEFSVCVRARLLGGELEHDAESTELRWVGLDDLPQHPTHASMALRINHYVQRRTLPYIH